jgi:hypothetical protein
MDLKAKSASNTTIKFEVTDEKNVEPRSGWPAFIKHFVESGVRELPDYQSLPDYYYNSDENLVTIEYTAAEYYKIISYPSRPGEMNLSPQDVKLENIIQYLEKELNFKRYQRPAPSTLLLPAF